MTAPALDTPQALEGRGAPTPLRCPTHEPLECPSSKGSQGKESTFEANLHFLRTVCSKVRQRDGEWVAVGRRGEVCVMPDGTLDVWATHPDRTQALSEHSVNAVLRHLPVGLKVHRLTGEAWCQTQSTELVRTLLKPLGIRQKRRVSEATRAKLASHLTAYRQARQDGIASRGQPGAAADDEDREAA